MAVVDHPTKFIFYLLLFLCMWGAIGLVNSLDHSSTAKEMLTNYKKNKKEAGKTDEDPEEKRTSLAGITTLGEPNFKPFTKVQLQFKEVDTTLMSDINHDAIMAEGVESGDIASEKVPAKEKTKEQVPTQKTNSDYFKSLWESYQKRVMDKIPSGDIRRDIIIRYYTHIPDGRKVYELENLGFYIHERPVEEGLDGYESNAIYYGDNVTKEDLQLVIYTLIKQGLPIKKVSLSKYHDGWKASSIEIGTDTTSSDKPVYTPERIQNLHL